MKRARFVYACALMAGFVLTTVTYAQQYMKSISNVNDSKFNDWVSKGELVKCRAFAHSAYQNGPDEIMKLGLKPSGVCYWDIDRAAELAPPPLSVHAGTRIVVRIMNPRQNETIVPAVVFAKIVPPSPGNDILKNAVNPLQAITLTPTNRAFVASSSNSCFDTPFKAEACVDWLAGEVNRQQSIINKANAALACIESYQVPVPTVAVPGYTCSTAKMIGSDQPSKEDTSFKHQREIVMEAMKGAQKLQAPLAELAALDAFLTDKGTSKKDYAAEIDNEGLLKNAVSAIQTAQATLQQSFGLLQGMLDSVPSQFYYYDVPRLSVATATITGTEVISKTSSTIATWTATSNSYNLVLSAGLGFSNLVNRSYSVTPQFQNGMAVLDPNGNAISVITETDNRMSVVAPEVMGSYVIPGLRKFSSSCSIGCSLLVSGGIGANLTTKTADFDTGISLRLWDILLTPAVHWGRETRLSDGFTVGTQLGANAPSSLPTHTTWVKKFAFTLTYVIPLS